MCINYNSDWGVYVFVFVVRIEKREVSDFLFDSQVVDLQVFAVPRITLKPLVPTFPCFAKIFVSLMEKV